MKKKSIPKSYIIQPSTNHYLKIQSNLQKSIANSKVPRQNKVHHHTLFRGSPVKNEIVKKIQPTRTDAYAKTFTFPPNQSFPKQAKLIFDLIQHEKKNQRNIQLLIDMQAQQTPKYCHNSADSSSEKQNSTNSSHSQQVRKQLQMSQKQFQALNKNIRNKRVGNTKIHQYMERINNRLAELSQGVEQKIKSDIKNFRSRAVSHTVQAVVNKKCKRNQQRSNTQTSIISKKHKKHKKKTQFKENIRSKKEMQDYAQRISQIRQKRAISLLSRNKKITYSLASHQQIPTNQPKSNKKFINQNKNWQFLTLKINQLRQINLSNNKLTDKSLELLYKKLQISIQLIKLNLSYNQLTDLSQSIIISLIKNSNLSTLNLKWNRFTCKSMKGIIDCIAVSTCIQQLDCSYNCLGSGPQTFKYDKTPPQQQSVTMSVCNLLMHNKVVIHLNLEMCNFSRSQCEMIAQCYNFNNHTILGFHFKGNCGFYINKMGYIVEKSLEDLAKCHEDRLKEVNIAKTKTGHLMNPAKSKSKMMQKQSRRSQFSVGNKPKGNYSLKKMPSFHQKGSTSKITHQISQHQLKGQDTEQEKNNLTFYQNMKNHKNQMAQKQFRMRKAIQSKIHEADCCWLCEKWVQQQFKITFSNNFQEIFSQVNLKRTNLKAQQYTCEQVFIHLNCYDYQPMLMKKYDPKPVPVTRSFYGEGHHYTMFQKQKRNNEEMRQFKIKVAVPSQFGLRYFYTCNGQVFNNPTEDLLQYKQSIKFTIFDIFSKTISFYQSMYAEGNQKKETYPGGEKINSILLINNCTKTPIYQAFVEYINYRSVGQISANLIKQKYEQALKKSQQQKDKYKQQLMITKLASNKNINNNPPKLKIKIQKQLSIEQPNFPSPKFNQTSPLKISVERRLRPLHNKIYLPSQKPQPQEQYYNFVDIIPRLKDLLYDRETVDKFNEIAKVLFDGRKEDIQALFDMKLHSGNALSGSGSGSITMSMMGSMHQSQSQSQPYSLKSSIRRHAPQPHSLKEMIIYLQRRISLFDIFNVDYVLSSVYKVLHQLQRYSHSQKINYTSLYEPYYMLSAIAFDKKPTQSKNPPPNPHLTNNYNIISNGGSSMQINSNININIINTNNNINSNTYIINFNNEGIDPLQNNSNISTKKQKARTVKFVVAANQIDCNDPHADDQVSLEFGDKKHKKKINTLPHAYTHSHKKESILKSHHPPPSQVEVILPSDSALQSTQSINNISVDDDCEIYEKRRTHKIDQYSSKFFQESVPVIDPANDNTLKVFWMANRTEAKGVLNQLYMKYKGLQSKSKHLILSDQSQQLPSLTTIISQSQKKIMTIKTMKENKGGNTVDILHQAHNTQDLNQLPPAHQMQLQLPRGSISSNREQQTYVAYLERMICKLDKLVIKYDEVIERGLRTAIGRICDSDGFRLLWMVPTQHKLKNSTHFQQDMAAAQPTTDMPCKILDWIDKNRDLNKKNEKEYDASLNISNANISAGANTNAVPKGIPSKQRHKQNAFLSKIIKENNVIARDHAILKLNFFGEVLRKSVQQVINSIYVQSRFSEGQRIPIYNIASIIIGTAYAQHRFHICLIQVLTQIYIGTHTNLINTNNTHNNLTTSPKKQVQAVIQQIWSKICLFAKFVGKDSLLIHYDPKSADNTYFDPKMKMDSPIFLQLFCYCLLLLTKYKFHITQLVNANSITAKKHKMAKHQFPTLDSYWAHFEEFLLYETDRLRAVLLTGVQASKSIVGIVKDIMALMNVNLNRVTLAWEYQKKKVKNSRKLLRSKTIQIDNNQQANILHQTADCHTRLDSCKTNIL